MCFSLSCCGGGVCARAFSAAFFYCVRSFVFYFRRILRRVGPSFTGFSRPKAGGVCRYLFKLTSERRFGTHSCASEVLLCRAVGCFCFCWFLVENILRRALFSSCYRGARTGLTFEYTRCPAENRRCPGTRFVAESFSKIVFKIDPGVDTTYRNADETTRNLQQKRVGGRR